MITTERLRCEPLTPDHADIMYPLLLDKRIYLYLPEGPPVSVDALRKRYEFLSSGRSPDGTELWLNWMLFEVEGNRPIGFFQSTVRENGCSIAYVLNPEFWGRGYASEAARSIIPYLFQTFNIQSVTTEINPQNEASQRFVKRLGLSFIRHDADEDDDIFEITRLEWFDKNPTLYDRGGLERSDASAMLQKEH
jgi:ribosomal-protein-alanine N-acetyltransferase